MSLKSSPNHPKISIYIASSLDGYIARKDGSLDWLDRVGGFNEDYGFQKLMDSLDAVILGRKTYEVAASVPKWPYKGKRSVVLSNSLKTVREEAELFRGDLTHLVSQLYSEGIRHIWVDGGKTISQFLYLEMVDSLTLSILPVLLGDGIPLFSTLGKELPCKLVSSQSYPSGLVQLNYEIIKTFSEESIHFKVIEYGGEEYKRSLAQREELLRKPLGLSSSPEELDLEKDHVHIAGFLGQELCATAVLSPEANGMKLQRVTIKPPLQNRGIGTALLKFCESYARECGFRFFYCYAWETAIPFYLKNRYSPIEEPFNKDGVLHQKMRKVLD